MEICHPWHAHPLFLSNEDKFEDHCSICEQRFEGNPFYACVDCKYYVHRSCGQLPVEIQHHFHHFHPLALSFGDGFACDSCHKIFDNELSFGCSDCDFDLDVKCALMTDIDTEGKEFIPHFTHQHPLTICSKGGDNPLICFACNKTSSDLIYGCTPCDYFLHKSCAEFSTWVLHAMHPQHALTLKIINVFKKKPEKVELEIVGDLRLEDTINPSHDNLHKGVLRHLLQRLDAIDKQTLRFYFRGVNLFLRKENRWETLEDKSSFEDDAKDIIKELSFYNDDIFWNIDERLRHFNPDTKCHIHPDEYELRVIEVEGYKVTSNFVPLFRALLMKYGDIGHHCGHTKDVKSVSLYFLCRIVSDMRRTYIDDITEKQLFTWLYYMRGISEIGFDLKFVKPFLDRITRSFFGLRAMKFEDEVTGRLDCEIVKVEKKIFELKTKREELKGYRQQYRVGNIAEESKVMKGLFNEAKQLKHKIAGKGII